MTEEEFYSKIPEWIEHDWERWNHITCLAYFCHKYELKNKVRFRLVRSFKGPTNGKESRDFSKLFETLAPENYKSLSAEEKNRIRTDIYRKIYNYINWMFDYKFRSGEKSVTGTRIFLIPALINEFERMYSSFLRKKDKQTKIEELISWCKENAPEIFDAHQLEQVKDLKMIKKYADSYSLDPNSLERIVLNKAKTMELI